jgi:hypothetical protein
LSHPWELRDCLAIVLFLAGEKSFRLAPHLSTSNMLFNLAKPGFTHVQYPALLEDWPSLGVLKTIIGIFFFLSTLAIAKPRNGEEVEKIV